MSRQILILTLLTAALIATACDAAATIEIQNGTNETLLVTIAEPIQGGANNPDTGDDLEAGWVQIPQGGSVEWSKIWGGGPPLSDLGQLQAKTLEGELVYERDLLLSNSDDGCHIVITPSVEPSMPVDCR